MRRVNRHTACFPLISPTGECSRGCRQQLLPHQDPAEREVQAAGLVLIFPREGGGGWTDMCVLVGSEGGPLEPAEYKEAKRAN